MWLHFKNYRLQFVVDAIVFNHCVLLRYSFEKYFHITIQKLSASPLLSSANVNRAINHCIRRAERVSRPPSGTTLFHR